jgi:predicted permease
MEWTRLGLVFVDIVLPLLTGYLLKTHNIISQKTCSRLILFNVVVLYTFINFISFWGLKLSASLLWLPIASILLTIIPGIICYMFFAGAFQDELDRGAYIISSMLSNIGTLSGLSAFILFGEPGFAYVQLVAAPQNCLMVAVCFPLARYFVARHDAQLAGTRLHLSVREMFFTVNQIALLGMLAGVLLQFLDIPRPAAIGTVFHYMVHILAWFSLLPVGFLIDLGGASKYYGKVKNILFQRFVLVPVLFYLPFRFLFHDPVVFGSAMVCTFSPGAINAVITSQLYKLNVDLTIAGFLLTTVVYIFVVFPLIFLAYHLGLFM